MKFKIGDTVRIKRTGMIGKIISIDYDRKAYVIDPDKPHQWVKEDYAELVEKCEEEVKQMKIGEEVFVHGYIDEIRKDAVIVKNEGGYFGTDPQEIKDVLDFTPCQVVDARTDKAYQDGYNKGFADGRKDVLNSDRWRVYRQRSDA